MLAEPALDSEAWVEEIFGPVVCIRPFDTEAEAIALANDSRFGLAAAVMLVDDARCERVAKAFRAGIVWINCSQPTFNAMCATTALLEAGMIPMVEPESVVTFDTAAGLVKATATCAGGKVVKVMLDMPPSFVAKQDAVIETAEWGTVRFDLCFGGVFYALVDVDQIGLTNAPENARQLAMSGVDLRNRIAAVEPATHPTTPALNGLAYVIFRSIEPDGALRTCTTLRPGRADRSPCGTGSNSNMATAHARGMVAPGDKITSRSIIGGEFVTEFIAETNIGPYVTTRNRVSDQCWIYGISQIGLDPTDPFPLGFTLSDTGGG